jgi:phosphate-selective porin OprO/OprP
VTDGGKERNVTAGINWYLTRYMRMMFNYVWVDAKRRGDLQTDRPQIFQLRMQLAI